MARMQAARPADERERLRALRHYQILDTLPERAFDDLVRLAAFVCGKPISLVTLVDDERQWFKARLGLELTETPRSAAFCAHAILQDEVFTVEDAHNDPRFADNPLVVDDPGIRFYAGAPLRTPAGHKLGTLCVIDRQPALLDERQRAALRTIANQVEAQLELRLQISQLQLLERQKQELTTLLVHDLKSPLASIASVIESLLSDVALPAAARGGLAILDSASGSLRRMIMNLLDVARSEEGALTLATTDVPAASLFAELTAQGARRAAQRGQSLAHAVAPGTPALRVDADLTRRVLENLIDNCIKYGPRNGHIRLSAAALDDGFVELRVEDDGAGIPPAQRERIFDKYVRLSVDAAEHQRSSRGLGLTFCKLAVEAHGGRIVVDDCEPHGARFRVTLPAAGAARPRPPASD